MRVFLTGGTGFVGREIVRLLHERGASAVLVSRNPERARGLMPGAEIVEGDPVYPGDWQAALEGCDAAIGLAGESVAGARWNARFKQRLQDTRVDSTRYLAEAIGAASDGPKVLVNASGIDYYPWAEELDAHTAALADDPVDELAPPGSSFLARLCRHWEDEAARAATDELRVVVMRMGLVLGRGGPLDRLERPFRFFAGGPLSSGQQWTSWVHLEDVARAYLHAIESPTLRGPVNLVAPGNVRQAELAKTLGRALSRPSWLPVPAFAISLAVGEFAEYIVHGRRAVPSALGADGFAFEYPELDVALQQIYGY